MIKPTVGRVLWVRQRVGGNPSQPEVALITYVHSDNCINVAGWNCNGDPFKCSSLMLKQGDPELDAWAAAVPDSVFAEWMPYQKGQAAKTEALESQLGGGAGAPA